MQETGEDVRTASMSLTLRLSSLYLTWYFASSAPAAMPMGGLLRAGAGMLSMGGGSRLNAGRCRAVSCFPFSRTSPTRDLSVPLLPQPPPQRVRRCLSAADGCSHAAVSVPYRQCVCFRADGAALTRVQRHAPRGGVRVDQVQTQPAFSRAGRIRYSGGRDRHLRVWILPTGKGQPGTTVRSLNTRGGTVVSWTGNVSLHGRARRQTWPSGWIRPPLGRTELTRAQGAAARKDVVAHPPDPAAHGGGRPARAPGAAAGARGAGGDHEGRGGLGGARACFLIHPDADGATDGEKRLQQCEIR